MSFNLDDLLNAGADQLESAPSFAVFCPGTHLVSVSLALDLKAGKGKNLPAVNCEIVYLGCLEKANPDDVEPRAGDKNKLMWFLNHEKDVVKQLGQGALKGFANVTNARFGDRSNMEVIDATKGQEMILVSKVRKSKDANGNDQENLDVVSWAMPE